MRTRIFDALEEVGLFFSEEERNSDVDIDLTEYILDSVQFISFIVAMEQLLGIEFPDEYLTPETLQSLNAFVRLVEDICSEQTNRV